MKIESVAIKSLMLDPENARTHSARNLDIIKNSLERFGQRKPVVVWQGTIIAGNGTVQAAKSLGWEKIEVSKAPAEWTFDEARAYALTDNRSSDLSDWDPDILKDQLIELDSVGWEVDDLGFAHLMPPIDQDAEWEGMPDFDSENKWAAFKTTVHFPTEANAIAFFKLIDRPKAAVVWYPEGDGHVGASVFDRHVTE